MRQTIDENSKKEGRQRSRLPQFTLDEIKTIKGMTKLKTILSIGFE